VTREGAVFAALPHKFEAGTVNAAGAVGLAAAIDYLEETGWDEIIHKEAELTGLAFEEMQKIPHLSIQGSQNAEDHHGIVSFTLEGVHPHDIASILDTDHIAVRAGHHCAQPLLEYLGVRSTARMSLAFYNTPEDITRFLSSLKTIRRRMGYGD
jgi:cysteine desulfurase/selenocysteine lyase